MSQWIQWGADLIIALQQTPALIAAMRLYSLLGTEEFFLLLMPAFYWCLYPELGARLAVVLIGSNSLNNLLKLAFHSPRPYWVDTRVTALSTETSYGMPSGHAQNAMAVWGYLATQVPARLRRYGWLLAFILIGFISLSRMYLGVHYPADVAAGILFGAVWLWLVWRWERPAAAWLGRQSLATQISVAALAALIYLALTAAATAALVTPDPAEWEALAAAAAAPEEGATAIDPRGLDSPINSAGMIFGLGVALACQRRWARFAARGPWGQRVVRYVIGLAGVLLFWRGLALVLPAEPEAVALVFRFVRYALVIIWALFLAPWVFLRLRLAQPAAPATTAPTGQAIAAKSQKAQQV